VPQGSFVQRDLDIAFLVKSIGGPRLLYALQRSHGVPSWRTVGRNTRIPRLLPSVAAPTSDEIKANITSFFDPSVKPHPMPTQTGHLPGNIAMFDGIALETKCRYCPKRDQILGLCREHSHNVNTKVDSVESVDKVCTALFDM